LQASSEAADRLANRCWSRYTESVKTLSRIGSRPIVLGLTVAVCLAWALRGEAVPPASQTPVDPAPRPGLRLWIDAATLASLPTSGPAWDRLVAASRATVVPPNLADQNETTNTTVMAKALVAARTNDAMLADEVRHMISLVIGTERNARTLSLGRKLMAYIVAADLVGLPPDQDTRFKNWLVVVRDTRLEGRTLRSTHEDRPNNWGTHAGASRIAIAAYLRDRTDLDRAAQVFRGWLGDRSAYAGFTFGDLAWQYNPLAPVGVNPAGATHDGHSIDGVLPDDERRSGPFIWPPPQENYVYEALQGALAQAVLLERAGYTDVWQWSDRALLRAYLWLRDQALYPAQGDDRWQLPILDRAYGTTLWDGSKTTPGKNAGWTDWTHPRLAH
jgi:hypothetical protein